MNSEDISAASERKIVENNIIMGQKGKVIADDNGAAYFIIQVKKIDDSYYCVASTTTEPHEITMLEMRVNKNDIVEIRSCLGDNNFGDIMLELLDFPKRNGSEGSHE